MVFSFGFFIFSSTQFILNLFSDLLPNTPDIDPTLFEYYSCVDALHTVPICKRNLLM